MFKKTITLKLIKIMGAVLLLMPLPTLAIVYEYAGTIDNVSGVAFVQVGGSLEGSLELDFSGAPEQWNDPLNVSSIGLVVTDEFGNDGFCYTFNQSCANGFIPEWLISSIDLLTVSTDLDGNPFLETLEVTLINPTFALSAELLFDFTDETFMFDYASLGLYSGNGSLTQVPLPASAWLFVTAIAALRLGRK